MKAVVTGATGFVGTVLCRELRERGWFVRAVVRDPSKAVCCSERAVISSIDAQTDWEDVLSGIDVVYHLAAVAHLISSKDQERGDYERVNARGTELLARAASDVPVRRLVLLSTVKVARERSTTPLHEHEDPQPVGAYARSKRDAEELVRQTARDRGLDFAIVRAPLVYGPCVRANFLRLLRIVERGVPLPLASVKNLRSLIYVENLADALIAIATHPRASSEVFYAADAESVSTPELIRRIAHHMHRSPRLLPFPVSLLKIASAMIGRSEAIGKLTDSLIVDTSKLRALTAWKPPHSLDEGLAATICWYRSLNDESKRCC